MNISSDDRRLAFFNLFDITPGQVNIVHLYPGSICAWHRHQKQTDYYFPVSGVVKVGMIQEARPLGDLLAYPPRFDVRGLQWETLDAHYPRVLEVPPPCWHGYTAIGGPAILLQYLTEKYSPDDEERLSVSALGVSWAVEPR